MVQGGRGFVFAFALLACTLLGLPAVGAHGQVVNASPEPASTAGGALAAITMLIDDPVRNVSMSIDGPDGEAIPSTFVHRGPTWLQLDVEAITDTGRYIVRYEFLTNEDRVINAAYWFDYEPSAAEPVVLNTSGLAWVDDSSVTTTVLIGLAALLVALVLATRWVRSRTARLSDGRG